MKEKRELRRSYGGREHNAVAEREGIWCEDIG
jgi:hypothetical protein